MRSCGVCHEAGHNKRKHAPDFIGTKRPGIPCPKCGGPDKNQHVADGRPMANDVGFRRRRRCDLCGHKYTTIERIEGDRAAYEEALGALDLAVMFVKRSVGSA